MAGRTLDSFLARARLFPVVVGAYMLLLLGLHFASATRAHQRLRAEVTARARAIARRALLEMEMPAVQDSLQQWQARGRQPIRPNVPARRLQEMGVVSVELLTPEGWGLVPGAAPHEAGSHRTFDDAERRRLVVGEPIVDLERGLAGDPIYAIASIYQPVVAPDSSLLGIVRLDVEAENLARSRRELRIELLLLGGSFVAFIVLLGLFTRWILRPLRLLEATARRGGADVADLADLDDTGFVIDTYRHVIEELQAKEIELRRLREVERHRADDLQELNASIVDSMVSGVLLLDLSGRIRSVNDAAREILGLQGGRVTGRPFREALQHVPEIHARLQRCLDEGAVIRRDETRLVLAGTGRRDVGLTLSPLRDAEHRRTGALCLIVDLTEVKRLQEQVRLKESLADLGELSGGIAHEFRNSLGTILGYARLVEKSSQGEPAENARAIGAEVGVLRTVVDDFLRFANPTRLVLETLDLAELFRELAADVESRAEGRVVRFDVQGALPTLTGDETLLRRAFTNLLRNAVDAVGDPGRVVVTGEVGDREVTVHVDDDGPGVAPEDREHLFTPFFTRKERGTGLGLAFARKVVVHHGGSIAVDASPLGGARFSVTLPLRAEREPSS